jgi:hypothetical protein
MPQENINILSPQIVNLSDLNVATVDIDEVTSDAVHYLLLSRDTYDLQLQFKFSKQAVSEDVSGESDTRHDYSRAAIFRWVTDNSVDTSSYLIDEVDGTGQRHLTNINLATGDYGTAGGFKLIDGLTYDGATANDHKLTFTTQNSQFKITDLVSGDQGLGAQEERESTAGGHGTYASNAENQMCNAEEMALRFTSHHTYGDSGAWARYRIRTNAAVDAGGNTITGVPSGSENQYSSTSTQEKSIYSKRNDDFAKRTIAGLQASVGQYQAVGASTDARPSFDDVYNQNQNGSVLEARSYSDGLADEPNNLLNDSEFNYWASMITDDRYSEAFTNGPANDPTDTDPSGVVNDPSDLIYDQWRNVFRGASLTELPTGGDTSSSQSNVSMNLNKAVKNNDILWVRYNMNVLVDNNVNIHVQGQDPSGVGGIDLDDLNITNPSGVGDEGMENPITNVGISTDTDEDPNAIHNPFTTPSASGPGSDLTEGRINFVIGFRLDPTTKYSNCGAASA